MHQAHRESCSSCPLAGAGVQIYLTLILLGFIATFAWIFGIWGAYRELMQTSRLRSAFAMFLFFLSIPVQFGAQYAMAALVIPAHGVPSDLIGRWHTLNRQTDTNGVIKLDSFDYFFSAPDLRILPSGSYGIVEVHGSTNGRCFIQVTKEEVGQLVVQGSTIILTPWRRTRSTNDQCTGKQSKMPADLSKSEYQYQLSRGRCSRR